MRVAAIIWCSMIPGLQVYVFRRLYDDLIKNHVEGPKGFRALLAPWVDAGFCEIIEGEIRFWNGSKIYLCHCQHDKDRFKYQGAEIHVLMIDELTHFSEVIYRFLRARCRAVGLKVPPEYVGKFPRILCGSNPGNLGHMWVKATWIDPAAPMIVHKAAANEGGMLRQYIPARLDDNPSMAEDDPDYGARVEGLGSEALVRAMKDGDWDIIEGAYFPEFTLAKHVVRPVALPSHWVRFRAHDWGSAKPSWTGWLAVSDGTLPQFPKGALVVYREWYTSSAPNVGLKLTVEQVAIGIAEREQGEKVDYGVADPAIFKEDGGPSMAQRMAAHKVYWRPADNSRIAGWDQMRSRLIGEDGLPMLYVFETCRELIRTLPAMQHDKTRPEDLDSDLEDHCFAAGTMVETEQGPRPIESLVGTTGRVLSVHGEMEDYRSARMTRRNAKLVRLTFDDGRVITCTPDHRFLADLDEWRYASDLIGRSVMCVPLSSARPSRSSTESAITGAENISSARESVSTSLFGNTITDQCRPGITSTTGTPTGPTTTLTTLNASQHSSICLTDMAPKAQRGSGRSNRELPPRQPLGMGLQRELSGIGSNMPSTAQYPSMPKNERSAGSAGPRSMGLPEGDMPSVQTPVSPHGVERPALMMLSRHVPSVAESSALIDTRSGKHAPVLVGASPALRRGPACLSVEEVSRADVYCLTVPATGCFAIEGGLIVSNCVDGLRYGLMSRPWARTIVPVEQRDSWADAFARARRGDEEDGWKVA